MPSVSKAQQRFMGMVHAAQNGEKPASPEVAKVAKDMTDKDAKDFASTSHKGLPNHIKKEILNKLKTEYGLMNSKHLMPAAPAMGLDDEDEQYGETKIMKLINLIPLKEIDFSSQGAFDTYSKAHKLRPDTKVKIAGKTTTAGQASKVKGTSVFGGDKKPDISTGDKKLNKLLTKHGITKDLAQKASDEATKLAASVSKGKAPENINGGDGKNMVDSIKDAKLNKDETTKELTSKLQKSPYGKFVKDGKNDNMTFFFYDGSKYEMHIDRKNKSITTKKVIK
jgi:hypothetical protein